MNKSNVDKIRFGRDIKKVREEKGVSQIEFAKEFQKFILSRYGVSIRVSQAAWGYYETGNRIPNLDRFYELCAFAKLKPKDYMIDFDFANDEIGAFDKAAFRAALLDTRREHNLTQKQAAEKSDVPIAVYERVEKSGIANLRNYRLLCKAFALDPNDFLYVKK